MYSAPFFKRFTHHDTRADGDVIIKVIWSDLIWFK